MIYFHLKNVGYELEGTLIPIGGNCTDKSSCLVCQSNKQWGSGSESNSQPIAPICGKISCGEPQNIRNGK